MRDRDTFRGCLIGGAAGDALGYAVEFMREKEIFKRYGEKGVTEYDLTDGKALISDDTQMTLFTANGLLRGQTRGILRDIVGPTPSDLWFCYRDWLKTQEERFPPRESRHMSWLANIPGLYAQRAPGNTCLSALRCGYPGSVESPVNESKGCGGVMRVAPVGLYYCGTTMDIRAICRFGAEAAALTHGHALGWIPAAMLTQIIHAISQDGTAVPDAVRQAIDTADKMWPDTASRQYCAALMRKALALAASNADDLDAIHQLGEGWAAEETLAIAIYCACRYAGDIDKALIAAVNHSGDSDSTGAVTGNIVGAQVGLSGIPARYADALELKEVILEIADDLWQGCPLVEGDPDGDPVWLAKYVNASYTM